MRRFKEKYRIIDEDRKEEFYNKGYKRRYFLPHKIYYIPKCGIDGLKLANRMWKITNPNFLWEIIIYALKVSSEEFPEDLFFDEDIVWHQQHLGKIGQIATANLIISGENLYTLEHISDIVQRIFLRKEFRTRVNSCFKYWHHMLLNSILNFAVENNLKYIYSPTADLLVKKFYPKVNRKYFDRIYDRNVKMHFEVDRKGRFWRIDVNKNRHKLVRPIKKYHTQKSEQKTICIFHDLLGGFANHNCSPNRQEFLNKADKLNLETMLLIEKNMNVKVSYNIVGKLFNQVREILKQNGHCTAFHTYNNIISLHPKKNYEGEPGVLRPVSEVYYKVLFLINIFRKIVSLPEFNYEPISIVYRNYRNSLRTKRSMSPIINQLAECRTVDYRIKGYRPSEPDLLLKFNDSDLCFYNYEWIAVNNKQRGSEPKLQNRIVRIPIFNDDLGSYKNNIPFEKWERKVIESMRNSNFVTVGLHDHNAKYWLPYYSNFIQKICNIGKLKTFNEVANHVFLQHAI